MSSESSSYRYAVLDGWRGICAVVAVIYHAPMLDHLRETRFFQNTFVCLEFFFVLSGFVMYSAYSRKVHDRNSFIVFIVRRFGRLWPLHVAVLGVMVSLELVKLFAALSGAQLASIPFYGRYSWDTVVANVLLVQSMGIYDTLTWNMPSWTVSTEFYTYFVFAILLVLVPGPRWRLPAMLGTGALAALVLALNWSPERGMDRTFDLGFVRCVYGFFVGCGIAMAWPAWMRVQISRPVISIAEFAIVVLVIGFASVAGHGPAGIVSPFVFGALVLVYGREQGPLSQVLGTRPFRVLGEWSYSIYMVHFMLIEILMRIVMKIQHLVPGGLLRDPTIPYGSLYPLISWRSKAWMDLWTALLVVCVVLTSAVTYRLIEMPARDWFTRLSKRWSGEKATIAT